MTDNIKARKTVHEGKSVWYGLYLDGGIWRMVCNGSGACEFYPTEAAALKAAAKET